MSAHHQYHTPLRHGSDPDPPSTPPSASLERQEMVQRHMLPALPSSALTLDSASTPAAEGGDAEDAVGDALAPTAAQEDASAVAANRSSSSVNGNSVAHASSTVLRSPTASFTATASAAPGNNATSVAASNFTSGASISEAHQQGVDACPGADRNQQLYTKLKLADDAANAAGIASRLASDVIHEKDRAEAAAITAFKLASKRAACTDTAAAAAQVDAKNAKAEMAAVEAALKNAQSETKAAHCVKSARARDATTASRKVENATAALRTNHGSDPSDDETIRRPPKQRPLLGNLPRDWEEQEEAAAEPAESFSADKVDHPAVFHIDQQLEILSSDSKEDEGAAHRATSFSDDKGHRHPPTGNLKDPPKPSSEKEELAQRGELLSNGDYADQVGNPKDNPNSEEDEVARVAQRAKSLSDDRGHRRQALGNLQDPPNSNSEKEEVAQRPPGNPKDYPNTDSEEDDVAQVDDTSSHLDSI